MTPARLFSLVFLLLVLSLSTMGQDGVLVREHFKDKPLGDVLKLLVEKYEVDINFGHEIVAPFTVKAKIKNLPVSETLDILLSETDLRSIPVEGISNLYLIRLREEAKSFTIRGTIIDKKTGAPMVGARVLSLKSKQAKAIGAFSDETGKFSLTLDKSIHREDTLEVYFFQYHRSLIPVKRLFSQPNKRLRISLMPANFELASVDIEADKGSEDLEDEKKLKELSRIIKLTGTAGNFQLDPNKVGFLVGLGGADILRTIQTLPGISTVDESAGSLNIRGSGEEENRIIYDGITIYSGNRLMGLIGSVNQEATQNVTLYSSGYDAKFGGRTGGVIEMEGRPMTSISEGKSIKTGANVLNLSGFMESPIDGKDASIMLAGRSSFPGVIQTFPYQRIVESRLNRGVIYADRIDSSRRANFNDPSYSFYDINGKINWFLNKRRSIVSLSFLKARDDFFYHSQKLDSGFSQDYRHQLSQNASGASLTWKYYGTKGEKYRNDTRLVYSGLNNNYRYQGEDEGEEASINRSVVDNKLLHDWSLQHNSVYRPDKYHKIETGFKLQYLDLSYTDQRIIQDTLTLKDFSQLESNLITAVYLQDEWTPNNKLSFKYGGRYTYLPILQRNLLAPRASFKYQVKTNWRVAASAGRYFQYIRQVNYLNDVGFGEQFWQLSGTDSMPVLRADHFQGGIAFEEDGWTLGLEAYLKNIDGLNTSNRLLYDLNNLRYYSLNENVSKAGKGSTAGLDLYAKYEKSFYTGWLSYSISRTRYQFEEINNGEPFLADQDRRHLIKLVNMFNWEDRFKLSAVFTWMSGNPVTAISGVNEILDENGAILFLLPVISEEKNGGKLPDYHRLDITSSWKVFERDGLLGKMGFSVFNVYNRSNIRDLIPSTNPNGNNNSLETRNLLGVSPNLFINLEF